MTELEDAAKENPPDLLKELGVVEEDLKLPDPDDDIEIYEALMKLKRERETDFKWISRDIGDLWDKLEISEEERSEFMERLETAGKLTEKGLKILTNKEEGLGKLYEVKCLWNNLETSEEERSEFKERLKSA
ncbi:hypothetical protein TrST_g4408 [Triparma strigata]|uniref:Uncharacterized protein n=1 Tax=Triparma strigata TaxID=1606541 RepID=A0A9W7E5A5_9STRA|nr:hypothetical protein TrST_g4408 [Triparma strigata]